MHGGERERCDDGVSDWIGEVSDDAALRQAAMKMQMRQSLVQQLFPENYLDILEATP